jgi:hypothetical protein
VLLAEGRCDELPAQAAGLEFRISRPPGEWNFDRFYEKHVSVRGFPVLASQQVSDFALYEAAYLIDRMLAARPDVLQALIDSRVRLAVMACSERTTDIPEHSDLEPADYWNRRARGLGATRRRPAVSCGEENLLGYRGDPYSRENILVHEFAHTVHQMGVNRLDRSFDGRLRQAYQSALEQGLWKGTYAASNPSEYWAEGVQSWFDTNRASDGQHNHVDTREELKEYDPALAALIAEVFGDSPWRYVPPARRSEPGHLAGYDLAQSPRFAWEPELERRYNQLQRDRRRDRDRSP